MLKIIEQFVRNNKIQFSHQHRLECSTRKTPEWFIISDDNVCREIPEEVAVIILENYFAKQLPSLRIVKVERNEKNYISVYVPELGILKKQKGKITELLNMIFRLYQLWRKSNGL
jgi:hypothetical protein